MIENKHILLAEDDADFGSILKQYLEMSGFSVEWAKDGEEALKLFKKNNFNIAYIEGVI